MITELLEEIAPYLAWFEEHVEDFRQGPEQDVWLIDLKKFHSLRVLEEAAAILRELDVERRLARDVLLAALLHDLGRFPQFKRYGTFQDAKSTNHAILGSAEIRQTRVLKALPPDSRALVREAVVLHNRRNLPEQVQGRARFAANVVRDSDKLDIVRIMLEDFRSPKGGNKIVRLNVQDCPEKYNSELVEQIFSRSIGDYRCMNYVNDFKLLLLSWIYDLNFASSRRAYLERGYVADIFAKLPRSEELARLKEHIYGDLG